MAGFFERRISLAAIWCRRLAVIAIPFLILTILFHRSGSISTYQVFWLLSFAIAMLLASLLFGMRAAADLWEKGYKGGRYAINGIILSSLLLVPFGIEMFTAFEKPQLNDVATDVISPPAFLSQSIKNSEISDYDSGLIVTNYPDLVSRRYVASPERVTTAVVEILNRWNWTIVQSVNLPASIKATEEIEPQIQTDKNDESDSSTDKPAVSEDQALAGAETEIAILKKAMDTNSEDSSQPDILIEADAKTMVLKLPSSVVVRLSSADDSIIVDMRSSTRWGPHDFGKNADNIVTFLEALDTSLSGLAGER